MVTACLYTLQFNFFLLLDSSFNLSASSSLPYSITRMTTMIREIASDMNCFHKYNFLCAICGQREHDFDVYPRLKNTNVEKTHTQLLLQVNHFMKGLKKIDPCGQIQALQVVQISTLSALDTIQHFHLQSLSQAPLSSSVSTEKRIYCIISDSLEHTITLMLTQQNDIISNHASILEQHLASRGCCSWRLYWWWYWLYQYWFSSNYILLCQTFLSFRGWYNTYFKCYK